MPRLRALVLVVCAAPIALCLGCGDSSPDGGTPRDLAAGNDLAMGASDQALPARDLAALRDLGSSPGDLPQAADLGASSDLLLSGRDLPLPGGDLFPVGDAGDASLAPDLAPPRDLLRPPDDLVAPALSFTVKLDRLYQGCMPIVPPDPLQISGTLTIANADAKPAGPFRVNRGVVTDAQTVYLGSFDVSPLGTITVPARGSVDLAFKKLADTLDPALRCQTVRCGSEARIGLYLLDGGGVTVAKPLSPPTKVECTF